jgi:hypothetical protein
VNWWTFTAYSNHDVDVERVIVQGSMRGMDGYTLAARESRSTNNVERAQRAFNQHSVDDNTPLDRGALQEIPMIKDFKLGPVATRMRIYSRKEARRLKDRELLYREIGVWYGHRQYARTMERREQISRDIQDQTGWAP